MKKELFDELMGSMGEALDHARGKRELRTTVLPAAPAPMNASEIRALRDSLNTSQAVFARLLNVSTQLVQAWEANRRQPEGAALRLLEVVKREPSVVLAQIESPAIRASTKTPQTRQAAVRRTKTLRMTTKRKPRAKKFRDLAASTMSKESLKRAAARARAMLLK